MLQSRQYMTVQYSYSTVPFILMMKNMNVRPADSKEKSVNLKVPLDLAQLEFVW